MANHRRRWDVATQERKVCNMEIEIVTFVVKGSAKLTVPTDWQEQIQVGSRSVALRRVFVMFCKAAILLLKIKLYCHMLS